MIQQLISNIIAELKSELVTEINESQIIAIPLANTSEKNPSQIAVIPGKLTISQQFKNQQFIYSKSSVLEAIAMQEFQQELFIDICHKDLGKLENFASLVTGIILTNQEKLTQNYNNQKTATQYTSKTISTTHTVSKINLLEGVYTTLETPSVFQLKFEVFGQLKLVKTVTEEVSEIEKIEINSTTHFLK